MGPIATSLLLWILMRVLGIDSWGWMIGIVTGLTLIGSLLGALGAGVASRPSGRRRRGRSIGRTLVNGLMVRSRWSRSRRYRKDPRTVWAEYRRPGS
jgi:hypothetical protein